MVNPSRYVLDAGTLIAFFNNESGADIVEDILTEPESVCYIHALNLCEIYYLYYRRQGQPIADVAVKDIADMGVVFRNDMDDPFWKDAASIKGRHALSLPDAFCLALAQRVNATVVTTDHAEFDPLIPLNYSPITFIR